MKIDITRLVKVDSGNLRGFFDIEIEGLIIRDCRIIQQPKMRAYCSGPQLRLGEREWKTVVSFQPELRDAIQAMVLPKAVAEGIITP